MITFIALTLTVLTFCFVAYPLFRRRSRSVDSFDSQSRRLYSKQGTTYSMIRELESDFQSGVLTEEEYKDLKARYEKRVIAAPEGIQGSEEATNTKRVTGEPASGLKRGKASNIEDEVERQITEFRHTKGRFCPKCGARLQKDDRFCSYCGARLG